MDEASIPGEPSPTKNFLGGSGCGCGCLGALAILAGGIALVGIPLGFYEGETNLVVILGGGGVGAGLLVALLGTAMWAGSLFID